MYKKLIILMLMVLSIIPINQMLAQNNTMAEPRPVIQKITLGQEGIQIKMDTAKREQFSTLRLAVWSVENGQDDLVWYTVSEKGGMVVPFNNHKGYGQYDIHVYQELDGMMIGLETKVFTIPKPTVNAKIEKLSHSSVTLKLRNVPAYMESVAVPVWGDENGQDDIIWYTAHKVGQGQYDLVIDAKNHNYTIGKYHVHIYGVNLLDSGKMTHMLNTDGFAIQYSQTKTGVITVGNIEYTQFSVPVEVSQVSHRDGIKSVRIAVWSDQNGQDDLVWYIANKQSNSEYRLDIQVVNHGNLSDTYYELDNGRMIFVDAQERYITVP